MVGHTPRKSSGDVAVHTEWLSSGLNSPFTSVPIVSEDSTSGSGPNSQRSSVSRSPKGRQVFILDEQECHGDEKEQGHENDIRETWLGHVPPMRVQRER